MNASLPVLGRFALPGVEEPEPDDELPPPFAVPPAALSSITDGSVILLALASSVVSDFAIAKLSILVALPFSSTV